MNPHTQHLTIAPIDVLKYFKKQDREKVASIVKQVRGKFSPESSNALILFIRSLPVDSLITIIKMEAINSQATVLNVNS